MYTNSKRNTRENAGLTLNRVGTFSTEAAEKAEILNTFADSVHCQSQVS